MDITERLMKALDTTKPDWWIVYATQQELMDCVRACTDGSSGTVAARLALRRQVIERQWPILSAALGSGIVTQMEG